MTDLLIIFLGMCFGLLVAEGIYRAGLFLVNAYMRRKQYGNSHTRRRIW